MRLVAILTSWLITVCSGAVLDVDKLNSWMAEQDKGWAAGSKSGGQGSNFAHNAYCTKHYKPTLCQQPDYGVSCFNYCTFRGASLNIKCVDTAGAKFCQSKGDVHDYLRRLSGKQFKSMVGHMLPGCYKTAICVGRLLDKVQLGESTPSPPTTTTTRRVTTPTTTRRTTEAVAMSRQTRRPIMTSRQPSSSRRTTMQRTIATTSRRTTTQPTPTTTLPTTTTVRPTPTTSTTTAPTTTTEASSRPWWQPKITITLENSAEDEPYTPSEDSTFDPASWFNFVQQIMG